MSSQHSEEERRAVFKYFMEPVMPAQMYEHVNPEVVDSMMKTFVGSRIVLGMRVRKLIGEVKKVIWGKL